MGSCVPANLGERSIVPNMESTLLPGMVCPLVSVEDTHIMACSPNGMVYPSIPSEMESPLPENPSRNKYGLYRDQISQSGKLSENSIVSKNEHQETTLRSSIIPKYATNNFEMWSLDHYAKIIKCFPQTQSSEKCNNIGRLPLRYATLQGTVFIISAYYIVREC